MLERTDREDLAVYVVWVPELGAREEHVEEATRLMPDPRARHYWDPEERMGRVYARVILGSEGPPLWDVYFLFDRTASWRDEPPRPDFWSHQLVGLDAARHFDADTFAERTRTLLRGEDVVDTPRREAGTAPAAAGEEGRP